MHSLYQPQEDQECQQQHYCQEEVQTTTQKCDGKSAGRENEDILLMPDSILCSKYHQPNMKHFIFCKKLSDHNSQKDITKINIPMPLRIQGTYVHSFLTGICEEIINVHAPHVPLGSIKLHCQ